MDFNDNTLDSYKKDSRIYMIPVSGFYTITKDGIELSCDKGNIHYIEENSDTCKFCGLNVN